MSFLTKERRSRLRLLLHTLAEGQRDHEEIARLDAQIRLDYHGRFLIELVQNAVDPAQRAGMEAAHILIVRTPGLLAVLNQGAPFDEPGMRSVLSLALSSKRPDEAIGNKGVGFKSVFEVAEAAEIYGVAQAGTGLGRSPALRFRVRRSGSALAESVVAEAMALLVEDSRLATDIAARQPDEDAGVAVRRALAASPAWRYPEELGEDAWTATSRALGLGKSDLAKYQTAVVLRLDGEHLAAVDRAVADFTSEAAEVQLFLPAVGRIEIREDVGSTVLERTDLGKCPASGTILRQLNGHFPDGRRSETSWWIASGAVSGPALEAAVGALPGEGWKSVRHAEVQVALPVPAEEGALAASGRYYVGLPTREGTGSPFHVDARFHATLSRTGLDRRDNSYNVLLDRHAAAVAASLVLALRAAAKGNMAFPDISAARRAVTLSLASGGDRTFATAVRAHLRDQPVVLLDDGERFAPPSLARRVSDEDAALIDLVEDRLGGAALPAHGVELVDRSIEASSTSLLAELGVPALKPAELLARAPGRDSVVERVAAALPRPHAGWTTLLAWFLTRVPTGAEDQRLLPVAGGGLVPIQARPFLPLQAAPAEGELRAGDVPAELLADLAFIDSAVLAGSDDLRRMLSEGQRPVAQRAIAAAAIRLAVVPAINRAADAGDDFRGRELLALALRLLANVAGSENVSGYGWRVPCTTGWIPADAAYLGDAWDDEREADDPPGIAEIAFASIGRCMIPWWGPSGDRAKARQALLRIGLDDAPRIWVYEPVQAAIWGDYHQGTPQPVAPPGAVPAEVWRAYLTFVCQSTNVDWGPQTAWRLEGLEWVDGLERADAAPSIAAWALSQKADPASLLPTNPRRYKAGAHIVQLWPFAIRRLDAAWVPSHASCSLKGRLARPSEVCRVPAASKDVPAWLPRAADELNADTLASVGVRALSEMPASWIVSQLSAFAATLDPEKKNGVVARGLWRLLNARAAKEALVGVPEAVLPVWLAGTVVGVKGTEITRLVIVDNAYDAEVLGEQLDGVHMLDPEGEDWRSLALRLREGLPGATIELVSELDYPYEADASIPSLSLVGVVTKAFGAPVVAAIAALLRQPKPGVQHKDVERAWTAFGSAKVQIGTLPTTAPPAVWLVGDNTLVCQAISAADVVVAMWPVVGAAWRHQLLALGHALGRGDRAFRDFLRHEGITEAMLDEAASRLGAARLIAPFVRPDAGAVRPSQPGFHALAPSEAEFGDELADGDGEDGIDLDAARERVRSAPALLEFDAIPGVDTAPPRSPSRPSGGGPRGGARPPGSRAHGHGDDEYARQIGHLGEHFAYRALCATLPGFDESCWKSSSRALAGLPGGDDTLGFDFHYVDVSGQLSGEPGAECFIEVKSNARRARSRFTLSNNEWKLAQQCHGSANRRFVILRVAGIADSPEVAAVIVDPVRAVQAGELMLTPKDGWWVDHEAADTLVFVPSSGEAIGEPVRR
ncbi:MAG: sacsin N-terminal ATP-binding-like domain-containing protein [Myxococcota bacterium]